MTEQVRPTVVWHDKKHPTFLELDDDGLRVTFCIKCNCPRVFERAPKDIEEAYLTELHK